MKKHLFLFSIVICLLFVSCSSVRFGHLARVKNTSKKNEEIKQVEIVSVAIIDNNDKTLDSVFISNNPQEILANGSKSSQIHPKKHKFLSKDFGIKNIINLNFSKKKATKLDIFQEEIEPPNDNTKKNNPNATAGIVFVILALFCMFGIISILSMYIGFLQLFALLALYFLQFLFSILAIVFGGVALEQIKNHQEYYKKNSLAIMAVIMGIIIFVALFLIH